MLDLEKIRAEKARRAQNKIATYFRDDGPTRRELYPKHLEHFAAGAEYNERLLMAANRVGKCIRINSLVDTVRGKLSVGELLAEGKPFEVWAWDGRQRVPARASVPFRKPGLHDCYRITMADGQWIECADQHRLLTLGGWKPLSQLLPQGASDHPQSISGHGHLIHDEGEHRWSGILPDYPERYSADRHHDDGLPRWGEDGGPTSAPSPDGALRRSAVWWHGDDQDNRCTGNGQAVFARLSSPDVQRRPEARYAASECRTDNTSAESLCGSFPEDSPLALALASAPRSSRAVALRTFDTRPASGSLADIVSTTSNSIIRCDYIGRHEVYDFHVDKLHNYIAADLVHHNSDAGAYETTLHLTGEYPHWWVGKRFNKPIKAWAASDTNKTAREVVQEKLLGPLSAPGTGFIPAAAIVHRTSKAGIAETVETIYTKHISGGTSSVMIKSYQEGRESFQGAAIDFAWLDETPGISIYAEVLLRTMTTHGQVIVTMTPLLGLDELVLSFLPEGLPAL